MSEKELTTKEIASRIGAHLKRLESAFKQREGIPRFFDTNVWHSYGQRVSVRYVSFQGAFELSKQEALAYLDSGGTERHQKMGVKS